MRRTHGGFNLLEVSIAAFIFATVAIALLGVWAMQVRRLEKSRHHLVATMLAEAMVEQTMDDGYERTQVTKPDEPVEAPVEMETEAKSPTGAWSKIPVTYQTSKTVEELGGKGDKLKKVVVEVTWEDSSGGGKISLITYLAAVF